MGLSVDDIVSLKTDLAGTPANQARLASYDIISDHLGREYIESERYGVYTSKEDRERFSWEPTDEDGEIVVNVPLVHQMIEDQRTVLGATRSVRVPPPAPPAAVTELPGGAPVVGAGVDMQAVDAAQKYANKLERGIAYLWKVWGMPRVQSEIAWYAVAFGTGVGVLSWDKKCALPRFVARSPENLYAQASVDNERELQCAVFCIETLGRSLNIEYGLTGEDRLDDDTEYELLDYYDIDQRIRCVDGMKKPLIDARNPIGRVPVFLFPGILTPNSLWGSSMLLRAIPVEREINRLYSVQAQYLRDVTEAPMVINSPEEVPENARWNRDCTISVGPQGGVGRAKISEMDGNMLAMRLADMKANLNATLDFSPVSQGQFSGNILTGKGVNALLSPNSQRMQARLQPIDPVYEDVNRCALLMWRTSRRKSVPIYGEMNGSMFNDSFDPKVDIDKGWVENVVYLDAAAFVDRQSARIAMLQEVRGTPRLMSLRRYLELNPDCDDPELEMARVKAEQREEMQMQIEMQQSMQAAQPQPAEAGAENYAAERGGEVPGGATDSPAAPPSAPGPQAEASAGAAPESAPGEATGADEPGETIEAVADLFREAQNIHGRVWLVGAAVDGLSPEELANSFLEVVVSDSTDKQTILNYLRKTPLKGFVDQQRVTFHEGGAVKTTLERVPNIEVTPGTEGYEPTPGTEEAPPEGETPEGEGVPPGAEEMMASMGAMA